MMFPQYPRRLPALRGLVARHAEMRAANAAAIAAACRRVVYGAAR